MARTQGRYDLLLPARLHLLKVLQPPETVSVAGEAAFKTGACWNTLQIHPVAITFMLRVAGAGIFFSPLIAKKLLKSVHITEVDLKL